MSLTSDLAYLTADLPGIGGSIRQRPEDFLVEEQPLGQPSGEGEFLYLYVEKTRYTTSDVARHIARAYHISPRDVAYAGLKDKHAVTRQAFCVHYPEPNAEMEARAISKLERHPGIRVVWTARHRRKLRRGQHGGNRFVIRIRDVEPTAVLWAKAVLDRLVARGVPNYFGDQRFGYRQNSHTLGRLLLKGDWSGFLNEFLAVGDHDDAPESDSVQEARRRYEQGDYAGALELWPKHLRFDRQALDALRQGKEPIRAVATIDAGQREFLINAFQSAIYNRVLDRRLRDGLFDRLVAGDLAWEAESKNSTPVDEARAADPQTARALAEFELSPTGPMWGPDMTWARGEVQAIEESFLAESGLSRDELRGPLSPGGEPLVLPGDRRPMRAEGSRRPMRIRVHDVDISGGVDEHGGYVRVAFELRRGAFATMVLREIMKVDMHEAQRRSPASPSPPASATPEGSGEDAPASA